MLRSKILLQLPLRTGAQWRALQMGLQFEQIAPVSLQAIERQAVFQPERVYKSVNRRITTRWCSGAGRQLGQTQSSLSLAVSTTCL